MGDVNGLLRLGSEPPGRRVQRAAAEDMDQTCPVRDRLLEPGLDVWELAVVRQHVVHRPGEPATGRDELVKRGNELPGEIFGLGFAARLPQNVRGPLQVQHDPGACGQQRKQRTQVGETRQRHGCDPVVPQPGVEQGAVRVEPCDGVVGHQDRALVPLCLQVLDRLERVVYQRLAAGDPAPEVKAHGGPAAERSPVAHRSSSWP
jgi:hypothetical protein